MIYDRVYRLGRRIEDLGDRFCRLGRRLRIRAMQMRPAPPAGKVVRVRWSSEPTHERVLIAPRGGDVECDCQACKPDESHRKHMPYMSGTFSSLLENLNQAWWNE